MPEVEDISSLNFHFTVLCFVSELVKCKYNQIDSFVQFIIKAHSVGQNFKNLNTQLFPNSKIVQFLL